MREYRHEIYRILGNFLVKENNIKRKYFNEIYLILSNFIKG